MLLVENRNFFIPLAFDAPIRADPHSNIAISFGVEKLMAWICLTV